MNNNLRMNDSLDYIYRDTPAYEERLKFISEGSHLFKTKLNCTIENNALFIPTSTNKKLHCFEGGVFNTNNKPILSAFQREGLNKIDILLENKNEKATHINERLVYLGQIRNHWGSFLVDSVSRLWFVKDNPEAYKYLYMITQPELGIKMHKNILRFLELFGIKESQIVFINEPTVVSEIIIPDMSYIPNVGYWKEYLEIVEKVVSNVEFNNKTYEKVYFSRKKFSYKSKTDFGEESIIRLVQKNEFQVFYPEELSLDDQIIIMNKCSEFASVGGSLAHNIIFCCIHRPRVTIFNRLSDYQWHQWMLNEMSNIEYTMVDAFIEPFKKIASTTINGPFLFSINKFIKKYICLRNWKKSNVNVIHRIVTFNKYSFFFFKMKYHLKNRK